jgi:tripartite-type tricarboxylate transporter receptor subunit TctC
MADLMGNQVPMLFSSQSPAVGPYNNGKIRALAVTSPKRSGAFPDVPTLDELGYKGFDSTGWFELAGPAGMAPEVVARLSQALLKAAEDKGLQEQLRQLGCDAEFLTPAQTLEKIKTDHAKWGKVIKEANIKAD